jgi:hypothetical protein
MSLIDTYQIASMGYNSRSTFTVASVGIVYQVQVDPLPPDPSTPTTGSGEFNGSNLGLPAEHIPHNPYKSDDSKKKTRKYKITVTATVDGKVYSETKVVEKNVVVKSNDVELNFDKNEKKIIINMR